MSETEGKGRIGTAREESQTPAGRRSLAMRLYDLFGMDGITTESERAGELRYRARRHAEIQVELPRLVEEGSGVEDAIRRIHRVLNRGKRYRNFHRLMKLLRPRGYVEGRYRETRQRGADYVAPRAADVPALMRAFGERLDELVAPALDDARTRLVCGWALAMMIRIHPFADGNGRTTRSLMSFLLARQGQQLIEFPSDSAVYKRSPVWSTFKDHMRGVRDQLGWSLRTSSVPPAGYFERLRGSLENEIAVVTVPGLESRPDIEAIAAALDQVREGFDAYR